jgi:single-strand DNA-binding protein
MINKAILMGRLTRDPELRHTGSGTPVCSFSIAIDNGFGDNRTTDFINCVAWNKTAEFVEKYFTKGRMIIVVGRISTRTWEGQDGKKNYATEVVANDMKLLGRRPEQQSQGVAPQPVPQPLVAPQPQVAPQQPSAPQPLVAPPSDNPDDLPF